MTRNASGGHRMTDLCRQVEIDNMANKLTVFLISVGGGADVG